MKLIDIRYLFDMEYEIDSTVYRIENNNSSLDDEIQVTVIATDFTNNDDSQSVSTFNPNFERKPLVTEVSENGIDLTENQLNIDSDASEFVPTFFNKTNLIVLPSIFLSDFVSFKIS